MPNPRTATAKTPTHTADHARGAARQTLKVTVLAGGPSAEREVSLQSGQGIAAALKSRGHNVRVCDISPDDLAALDHDADVVFPALHGTFGEDGVVQKIMEARGICFVGSGSAASALAMDKVATKQVTIDLGIDTPAFSLMTAESLRAAPLQWSRPVVVKPVDQGSSVLTTILREPGDLPAAVSGVVARYGRALVEDFIAGDELTVGILGGRPLPPICIRPRQAFYDYHAKYVDDATEYLFETGHPREVLEQVQSLSKRVFDRIGCCHLARVDWMIDRENRLWFLEINTLPGFTSHSLLPKAAARAGIPYDELTERLVFMALEENR